VLLALLAARPARAQEQTAVADAGTPPVSHQGEGAQLPASLAPSPPVAFVPPPDPWEEYIRAQQIVQLRVKADVLRVSNRSLLAPGVVLGIGVASLLVGGIVFARAWNASEDYSVAGDRAGLVMMPVGAALTVSAVPVLAVRLARTLRLQRVEHALRMLGDR
jgi:hypothetical protein